MKVILKPTKFKNDQVLINGYSFGGTSLASDDDYTSAELAGGIVGESGIADFTQIQLNKILSGKNVTVSPYISDFAQGITANTTPRDFETAMQLIYLYFTQPRKDADVWQANISQTNALLATRGVNPGSVFQDTISATLNNHNFREMVVTPERLNKASLDKAYAFYKDRFGDASGFTFTFVGNFDVEVLKPYLEAYLGGLPSTNKKETYKNLNIVPPGGQITKTVNKGIGEKASVQMVFSGAYDYNDLNNIQIDALEEILQIRLLDRLREKDGGTYAPGVRANYKKIPNSRFSFTVSFTCAPADVERLISDALDEVNKLKQSGAVQADIDKFVAEDARSMQVQMKENIFWAGFLGASAQNQEDPDAILKHVSSLSGITPQSTKDAANKYLSGTNLIKFILLPEKK